MQKSTWGSRIRMTGAIIFCLLCLVGLLPVLGYAMEIDMLAQESRRYQDTLLIYSTLNVKDVQFGGLVIGSSLCGVLAIGLLAWEIRAMDAETKRELGRSDPKY